MSPRTVKEGSAILSDAVAVGGLVTGVVGTALPVFTAIRQVKVQRRVSHLENQPELAVGYGVEGGDEYLEIADHGPLDLSDVFVELHGGAGWQPAVFHVAPDDGTATPDAKHFGAISMGAPKRAYIDRISGQHDGGVLNLRMTCQAATGGPWTLSGTVMIPRLPSRPEQEQHLLLKELAKAAGAAPVTDSSGLGGEVFFYNPMGAEQYVHHPGFPGKSHQVRNVADIEGLLKREWISVLEHNDSGGYTFVVTPTGGEAARRL
jgi:hypothetical protein